MTIAVGDKMPKGRFDVMRDGDLDTLDTDALFPGRKVVLISVPGAFTPTCSMSHLPGFVKHADEILAKGVDAIACMAVNDVFVMNAWGREQGVGDKILIVDDGKLSHLAVEQPAQFEVSKAETILAALGD